jgi:hypothetical protein
MSEDRRQHTRVEWTSPGRIDFSDGKTKRFCLVHNLSNGGARLTSVGHEMLPDTFKLRLSRRDQSRDCKVIWRTTRAVGVQFLEPVPSIPSVKKTSQSSEPEMTAF